MPKTVATALLILVALAGMAAPWPTSAQTLDRIRESGVVRVGHRTDAPPFSFTGPDGQAAGYSVDLCKRIVEAIGSAVGREVTAEYVPLTTEDRFEAVAGGRVDMHCGAATATLERREQVSFSVPIFITGVSALMSADAPQFLRDVIAGEPSQIPPRLAVIQALEHRTFAVRAGTTAETWLRDTITKLAANAEIVTVQDHAAGIAGVASGEFDAYFADRALLLGQLQQTDDPDRFVVADRLYTFEPYAIVLPRADEDFRLLVDRTLSELFRSGEYLPLFQQYFGTPSELVRMALEIGSLPE